MAQVTIKTANQIIDLALRRIGNTTITADAQAELNNILDRLYTDFRWPFLKTIGTGSISEDQTSEPLPSTFVDLWDRQSLHLIDPTTNARIPLETLAQQGYDPLRNPRKSGTPSFVVIDYNTMTWITYPLPNKAYDYEIIYRARPAQITDFDTVINFPNESLLEQLLFAWACDFEDDERANDELAKADRLLRQFLKSFNVNTGKSATMSLRPSRFFNMGCTR